MYSLFTILTLLAYIVMIASMFVWYRLFKYVWWQTLPILRGDA